MKTFLIAILCLSLLAGISLAQERPDVKYPKFVASVTSTGYVPLFDHTKDLQDNSVLSIFQVTAVTDCTFTFWRYDATSVDWSLLSPALGATAADSVLTIAAGQTETYWFPNSRPTSMNAVSGSFTIKAE